MRGTGPSTTLTLARAPGAELHVVDLGPGMSEADRERAFDRFWWAAGTHHDGTGLGLPIVRHLVRVSGGETTLRPAPGSGLDACVRLRPATGERPRGGTGSTRPARTAAAPQLRCRGTAPRFPRRAAPPRR